MREMVCWPLRRGAGWPPVAGQLTTAVRLAPRRQSCRRWVVVVVGNTDPAAPDWGRIVTDEQWTEVVRHSGLPRDARPPIGMAIATYRSWQAIIDRRKTPSKIRVELESLRKDAEALRKHLIVAMSDADMDFALTYPLPPPKGWPPNTGPVPQEVAQQRLNGALYELERLVWWLRLARDRVRGGKRGQKRLAVPAYFLVNRLNEILERFTGKTIIRSMKRPETVKYVKTVCRIADPKIGDGTVIEAIKKEIKYYRPFGGISPDPAGVIPPPIPVIPTPNRRDNRPSARKVTKRDLMEN